MMPTLTAQENAAILEILERGGSQARKAASQTFGVFEKGRDDYVTTVDRDLDAFLAAAFQRLFPHDGIVTEENQASANAFGAHYSRLWFIDPIDGTEDFIHRGQHYSVMVGLLSAAQPQAGWVYAPAQNRLYWGGPRWGLFQQQDGGGKVALAPCSPQGEHQSVVILGDRDQRRFGAAIQSALPDISFDTIGSFGLKVIEVIKGQAGLYVYLNGRVKLWDTTGPLALAMAAGLTCCDLDGCEIRFVANSIYPETLIHRQPIVVGWPAYVAQYLPRIREAVIAVRRQELSLAGAF